MYCTALLHDHYHNKPISSHCLVKVSPISFSYLCRMYPLSLLKYCIFICCADALCSVLFSLPFTHFVHLPIWPAIQILIVTFFFLICVLDPFFQFYSQYLLSSRELFVVMLVFLPSDFEQNLILLFDAGGSILAV